MTNCRDGFAVERDQCNPNSQIDSCVAHESSPGSCLSGTISIVGDVIGEGTCTMPVPPLGTEMATCNGACSP